jgi:hypothetical protein
MAVEVPAMTGLHGPGFELSGWQFFALDRPLADQLDRGGDAKARSPTGEIIGLVWDATGRSQFKFDFAPSFGPMLYVEVPHPVGSFPELRLQFIPLMPAIEAEYSRRGR